MRILIGSDEGKISFVGKRGTFIARIGVAVALPKKGYDSFVEDYYEFFEKFKGEFGMETPLTVIKMMGRNLFMSLPISIKRGYRQARRCLFVSTYVPLSFLHSNSKPNSPKATSPSAVSALSPSAEVILDV